MRVLLGVILAVLSTIGGCSTPFSDPGNEDLPPPSPLSIEVPSARWVAVDPQASVDGAESFTFDIDRAVRYPGPGIHFEDSFDCALVAVGGQWLDDLTPSYRAFGGPFTGQRDRVGEAWVNHRLQDGSATSSGVVGGEAGGWNDRTIAANFHLGASSSNLTLALDAGGKAVGGGPFWCLDGPWLWQGGAYDVTPTSFFAEALTWDVQVERGILARLQTSLSLDLRLTAPDGQDHPAPQGGDLTFCMEGDGPWTFSMASRPSLQLSASPWVLRLAVFDVADTGFMCEGRWTASPTR